MEKYMKENIEMRYKKESIIMNLELDELHVISESLDLLKNKFGTEITVGKINIQDILDMVDNAIDKIENDLEYPIFVKPANLGSSVGISKATNRKDKKVTVEFIG